VARVRRLHPDPAELDADAFLAEVRFPAAARDERPHVAINMVASVDGRTAVRGLSAPLTSPFDRALFHALRGAADAVLVGTRTLAAERYAPLVRDPARREARVGRGLAPVPIACVVTRSGQVDFSVPLFDEPEQTVVVFSGRPLAAPDRPADVQVVELDAAALEPSEALSLLRSQHGVDTVLCEGGATLNGALMRAGVVDELFLSVAPALAGDRAALPVVAGEAAAPAPLELRWMLEADDTVFLRYGVTRAG
jgi:riboflavin biosynthesis pyrimidine reductase